MELGSEIGQENDGVYLRLLSHYCFFSDFMLLLYGILGVYLQITKKYGIYCGWL